MSYIVYTFILLLLLPVSLFCLFYLNSAFHNSIITIYNKIKPFLYKKISRNAVDFLVHGGFHSLILIIVIICIILLWIGSRSQKYPEPKKISMTFTRESIPSQPRKSPVNAINISFILNSDSLYEESGHRGKSGVKLNYWTVDDDSIDMGRLYLSWENEGYSYVYREINRYRNKPEVDTLQYSSKSSVYRIIPTITDMFGFDGYFYNDICVVNDDGWGTPEDNPYYYYHLNINLTEANLYREAFINNNDFWIEISFQVGDILKRDSVMINNNKIVVPTGIWSNKNLKYTYISPTPDVISNGIIKYNSKSSIEKLLSGQSIVIQAEDIELMKKNEQESLALTVLLGMLVGFLLDVFIQLVKDLRNINRKNDVDDSLVQDASSQIFNFPLVSAEINCNEDKIVDELDLEFQKEPSNELESTDNKNDAEINTNLPLNIDEIEENKNSEENYNNHKNSLNDKEQKEQ